MERKVEKLTSTALCVQRELATQELQSSLTKHGDEMKKHISEQIAAITNQLEPQWPTVLKKIGSLATREDNKRIIDEHFRSVVEAIDNHKSDISTRTEDMEDVSAVVEQRDEQLRRTAGSETENARLTYARDRALATLDDERRKAQGYFRIRKRSLKWASTGLVALTALRNSPNVLRAAGRWSVSRLIQVGERMAAYVENREQNST
ncbi:hypothetical protein LQW54_004499 [Pestalotiopsis sp. IQ-011]